MIAIQQLIENPTLCTWSRNAAIKSLLVLVKEKILTREFVLDYFKHLFNHLAFKDDPLAIGHLINAACRLYPDNVYDMIKTSFEEGAVETFFMDMRWVDDIMALGQETALKTHLFDSKHYALIDNAMEEMKFWVCFQPEKSYKAKRSSNAMQIPYQQKKSTPGRNDACPCASGKKYKKCCLHAMYS